MIAQDGSEFLQLVLADWYEDQGDTAMAESLRQDVEDQQQPPWQYEYRVVGGGSVVGVVGVIGGSGGVGGGGVGVGSGVGGGGGGGGVSVGGVGVSVGGGVGGDGVGGGVGSNWE